MTATAASQSQHQRTTVCQKEWLKLFPRNVTENYTQSATFMKQLTTVAISTIAYLKHAFHEDSFNSEQFAGVNLKLLKTKCSDELAQFVSTSMQQAFEAFDKKYINQLALCFYKGDCTAENLIEYHVFEYSYNEEGYQMSVSSKNRNSREALKCTLGSVMNRTVMFVRSLSLYLLQNCNQELPLNYDISLRVYYNDDAPEDYQAPGFRCSSDEDHLSGAAGEALRLGWVDTPYHSLIARTFIREGDLLSDQAMPSDNVPVMSQADNDDDFQLLQGSESSVTHSEPLMDMQLLCPCAKQDTEDQMLVTCKYCNKQQHAACFGLLGPYPEHCCDVCADADHSRKPSDRLMLGQEYRKRECLSLYRRTLYLCIQTPNIDGVTLMNSLGINERNAAKMLRILRDQKILPNTDIEDLLVPREINRIQLDHFVKFYFPVEEDNMAERLVAESASENDPIGDVLSPLEKIALYNTSNLGVVIEHPPEAYPVINDPLLQQYREVILNNEAISEELPLSGSHNPVKDVEKIGKKQLKRKNDSDDEWLPKLRSGVKTKKKTY